MSFGDSTCALPLGISLGVGLIGHTVCTVLRWRSFHLAMPFLCLPATRTSLLMNSTSLPSPSSTLLCVWLSTKNVLRLLISSYNSVIFEGRKKEGGCTIQLTPTKLYELHQDDWESQFSDCAPCNPLRQELATVLHTGIGGWVSAEERVLLLKANNKASGQKDCSWVIKSQ